MSFQHPQVLWLLLLILPLLTAFLIWSWVVKRRLILQFVRSRLLANLTVGVSEKRQKFRMALLVTATAGIVVALARPQWGFDYEEVRQKGLDVVLAIDTSRSMLAEDVPPNRLTRAKLAALDIKKLARTDRLGLVAFAGSAFLQCPLSFDAGAFEQSVQTLDTTIIPQGGTAVGEAILCAQSAFKEKNENHKVLILFTDGEDHDGEALEAARNAGKEGMRIFTVGLGSKNGELLRLTDGQGRSEYLKDSQGQVVKSRLNEKLLQEIAQATDGFYMHLSGPNTMDVLYERGLAPLPKSNLSSRRMKRFHERFQWMLGLAILILAVELVLPERKRPRRSENTMNATSNAGLRKAVALFLFALPVLAMGSDVSRGWKAYQAGNFNVARLAYEKALADDPKDSRLHFNAGVAAFRSEDFETAAKHLQSALLAPDLSLQQKGYYNLGNTQFRLGEKAQEMDAKKHSWQQALENYQAALRLEPKDADAKHNLELVQRRLEELKQQEQKQQQQKPSDQDKKDDKNQKDQKTDQSQKDQSKQDGSEKKDKQQDGSKPDPSQQEKEQQKKNEDKNQGDPKDQSKEEAKKSGDQSANKEGGDNQGDQAGQKTAQMIPMTQEQAKELLDTQKFEERPLTYRIVTPKKKRDRIFKDW